MVLIKSLLSLVSRIRWLWPGYCWRRIAVLEDCLRLSERDRVDRQLAAQVAIERADIATEQFKLLRSQIMQLRVGQAVPPRTGWEIMAYIPQEVVDKMTSDVQTLRLVESRVARGLVAFALKGVVNVNSQGRVNALVFEPLSLSEAPRAPRWVQALYERGGKFKMSPRAHLIEETEEQRVRRASGL